MSLSHIDWDDPEAEIQDFDGVESLEGDIERLDFEGKYIKEGQPDVFHYRVERPRTLKDTMETVSHNDPYLVRLSPRSFFGKSIINTAKVKESWEKKSGFNKETFEFADKVEEIQPRYGHTEGGKGLTFYMRPVIQQHGGMGSIQNVNISHGCFDLTDFHANYVTVKEDQVPIALLFKRNVKVSVQIPGGGWAKISEFNHNGNRNIYKFTDEENVEFKCTEDHSFMTEINGEIYELPIKEIFKRNLPLLKEI